MDCNRIILELLDRIQVLEKKVKILENKANSAVFTENNEFSSSQKKVSVKYRALTKFLIDSNKNEISLTYNEIENILGFNLPLSAHDHIHSFWANTYTHSYATSWLAIGYKTKVNPNKKVITFNKNFL